MTPTNNSSKKISALLKRSYEKGISVFIEDEKLKIRTTQDVVLDHEIINLLKENKAGIVSFLKNNKLSTLPSITAQERPDRIPLSFSQERLWFIDKLEGSVHYHIPAVLRLQGSIDKEALAYAFREIVNRHEVLRTVIVEEDGQGYQQVLNRDTWELMYTAEIADESLEELITQETSRPFDLSKDRMLRAHLVKLSEEEHLLMIVIHHIAADGWSMPIIVNELRELYKAYIDQEPALVELPIQYADYTLWQRSYLTQEVLENRLKYWQQKLTGLEPLNLPTDYIRPVIQSNNGRSSSFQLNKDLSDKLQSLSDTEGTTLFMTLLSAFKVLLYRYTGQSDVCVGSPIANRTQKEVEPLVGFFVNTLALRSQLAADMSFKELLAQVKQTTLEAYQYQDVPFEKVVDKVSDNRDRSRSPLFQVMLVLQNNAEIPALELGTVRLSQEPFSYPISKFDITFNITQRKEGIDIIIEYNTDLFAEQTIARLKQHYERLLLAIVANPRQAISKLTMLDQTEEEQLLHEFNHKADTYPLDKTIVDLFEEQVARVPNNISVVFEDKKLSYTALNKLSNQLGDCLKSTYGIKPDDLIGIRLDRSEWMIVAILGILKSGGAYVPIDPSYPQDRIDYIVKDSACKVVIDEQALERFIVNKDKYNSENPDGKISPRDSAYVIYTSGSTGKPKGVLIEHWNVVRLFKPDAPLFDFKANDVWTLFHSYSFDFSVWEMYGALLFGGKVVVVPKAVSQDPYLFKELIKKEGVTVLSQTPGAFYNLIEADKGHTDAGTTIRYVIFGGEALSPARLKEWKERYPGGKLINMYGITETTVHVTYKEIGKAEIESGISNIGKTIPTLSCYILDADQHLVPIGVAGELHIGGAGLAREYLNRPELTAEKFIAHPYKPGERLYKTGDLGRWLPDGNIEYLGRKDDQVKIRGYRIELGEIENALQKCDQVKQSVVLAKADAAGNRRLVAYIVSEGSFDKAYIQSHLRSQLPDYMIPALMMALDKMPLNANGKVDKKALPDPDASVLTGHEYVAPGNEVENQLCEIYAQVLGLDVDKIGINDDFFRLGGDSIVAIRLISKINDRRNTHLKVGELFSLRTVRQIAGFIANNNNSYTEDNYQPFSLINKEQYAGIINLDNVDDIYPVSHLQMGMLYESHNLGTYHDILRYRINSAFDHDRFIHVWKQLIDKHTLLRAGFVISDNGYDCVIHKTVNLSVKVYESEDYETIIDREKLNDFDFSEAGIFRLIINKLDNNFDFILSIHHAIADGWSIAMLINECVIAYTGTGSINKDNLLNYGEFIAKERRALGNKATEDFWRNYLQDSETTTGSKWRSSTTDLTNDIITSTFTLNEAESRTIHAIANRLSTSVDSVFKYVYINTLARFLNANDITIGLVTNNRLEKEGGDTLLGLFLNTIPYRYQTVSGFNNYEEEIVKIFDHKVALYKYKEYPYGKIKSMYGRELYQFAFNFIHFHILKDSKENIIEGSGFAKTNIPFILDVAQQGETGFDIIATAHNDFIDQAYLNYFIGYYKHNLYSLISGKPDFQALTLADYKVIDEWNHTATTYSSDKTIIDLFEEQVARTPDHVAVVFEDTQLSYGELNMLSNQLGAYLRTTYQIQPDDLIGIRLDRSEWMMVSILGILKSGGAYVPIDPSYPQDRIDYIVEDSGCKVLIDTEELAQFINDRDKYSSANQKTSVRPDNLVYCIYTSGTTGKPKGALIEHMSLVNRLQWMQKAYPLSEKDRVLQKTTYSFDVSVWELLWWSMQGASVCMLPGGQEKDPGGIVAAIQRHSITVTHFVPSMLAAFMDYLEGQQDSSGIAGLKQVFASGEALTVHQTERFRALLPDTALMNLYGPTEATIDVSYFDCSKGPLNGIIPIGKPIDNTSLLILDADQHVVPIGVAGELHIGGVGLARGYLNRPELTAEKFITHPYKPGERLYKTGDLSRWLPDGNIEYLGRKDDQVKIRGYRIELGEIGNVLQKCDQVKQNVVVAKADATGNRRLVAYIVSEGTFDKSYIQSYLRNQLPDYMIPSLILEIDNIPLNANGKVDKKALPDPDTSVLTNHEYVAPGNEVEESFVSIWKEILQVERVGIHDSFFELGGDSIMAIQIVSRARKLGYIIQPKDLFKHPTIAQLSLIPGNRKANLVSGEQGLLTGLSGMLPIQQRFFENRLLTMSHFNQSILLGISREIEPAMLETALKVLVDQHDALRLKYQHTVTGWQQAYGTSENTLAVENLQQTAEHSLAALIQQRANHYQKSLDIEKGVLMRVVLMQMPSDQDYNRLLIIVHHLAIDGVSWRIILNDLESLLSALRNNTKLTLGNKSSSYRQWYAALENYGKSKRLLSQKEYWNKVIATYTPMPVDDPYTGVVQVENIDAYTIRLHKKHTQNLLQEVLKVYHTEMDDLLLTALSMTLTDWSGKDSVTILLEGHGREEDIAADIDISHTVGWFTSLYPVLLEKITATDSPHADDSDWIKGIKEQLRKIPDKGIGYGVLKYINKEISLEAATVGDVLFNYLGQLDNVIKQNAWFTGAKESSGEDVAVNNTISHKIEINSMIVNGELMFRWSYSTKHYKQTTIADLAQKYISNLERIIHHCLQQVDIVRSYTPSDYGLGEDISYQELDRFLEKESNMDNIMEF